MFLKEIPFASLTNAIDLKIERVMPIYMSFKSVFERNPLYILHKCHRLENLESSNRLFDWLKQIVQPIKNPVRTLSIFRSMAFVKDAKGISFKNILKRHINWRKVRNFNVICMDESI
jgi:hypothetical protein